MSLDTAEDIAINKSFEVFLNARGDLATVSGRQAFEQRLGIRISKRATEIIGTVDEENIPDLLETEARQVAAAMGELESVAEFNVEESDEKVNTYVVEIIYDSGDDLIFEV